MNRLDAKSRDLLAYLRSNVIGRYSENKRSESYYDSTVALRNLNIAVPPTLANIDVASDWPSTIVDAYHERLNFEGWKSNKFGMGEMSQIVQAQSAVAEATLDAGIYGVGFLAVESPYKDSYDSGSWRLKSISPLDGTVMWDYPNDRPLVGYRRVPGSIESNNESVIEIMYLPWRNLVLESKRGLEEDPVIIHSQETGCPRPAIARIRSKMRSKRFYGRSMITPPVRYYTDAAMRTLLGMEINREFYTTPQRWAMNADMSMFTDSENPSKQERIEAGWAASQGKLLALPPPEAGEPSPVVGQFTAAPPTPYIEQLRGYSQLLASATGMPSAYLGFTTENPPSADAIRAWLERLVRSVIRQQRLISPDLREIGWVLHTVINGSRVEWPDFSRDVVEKWENPATETLAADVDAVTKAISVGITDATSDWVFDRLRIPESQRLELRAKARQKESANKLSEILKSRADRVPEEVTQVADSFGKVTS